MLKNHVLGPQAAVPRIKISDESECVRRRAGETRSKEIAPDVMLPVLCLPRPVGENLGRKFPGPSLRSELAQPMCRVDYSRTEEKRELGMTKVTDITDSNARCNLLNNSADYGALSQVKSIGSYAVIRCALGMI
jgi:hypothetical protein